MAVALVKEIYKLTGKPKKMALPMISSNQTGK